jgi:alkanesulfonate monooxygenase SsuD/methylene tetrahydromethanopterin reductase-like flavin-dependent oxidoreductase (luciferase family)
MLRLGLAPHRLWPTRDSELDDVLQTAREAERLGFDHVIAGSHVLRTDQGSTFDTLLLLGAIGGATERIRLVTSVLIAPLHQPVMLAHQAATLDVLTRGRFVLGVGVGWDATEFAALEAPFAQRGRRTDAALATLRRLWRGEDTELSLGVAPRTAGGPPLWVGGTSDAALRRALRHADAWHGSVETAQLPELRGRIAALADEVGRDPATLGLTTVFFLVPPGVPVAVPAPAPLLGGPEPSTASVAEELGRLAEAGVESCSVWLPVPAEAMPDAMGWLADAAKSVS